MFKSPVCSGFLSATGRQRMCRNAIQHAALFILVVFSRRLRTPNHPSLTARTDRVEPKALPGPASERMSKQRSRDTGPERLIRSALHRRGLRYFVHRRPLPEVRREADVVFPRLRVAIFVDGCFWHGCPEHGTKPRRNAEYWETKIARNRARDADTDARLEAAGWTPVRIWEHEEPDQAADQIEQLIRARAHRLSKP